MKNMKNMKNFKILKPLKMLKQGKCNIFGLLNWGLDFFSILGTVSFSSVWDKRKIYKPRCVTFPIE